MNYRPRLFFITEAKGSLNKRGSVLTIPWALLLASIGMLALLSCTRDIEYSKDGATPDELYWDRYQCIAPRGARMDRPIPGPNELDQCLAQKGWRRVN